MDWYVINFCILSIRFFLKRKGLFDVRVAAITKKEYGFEVHFLYRFIKSLMSISDELWNAICLSSHLFGICKIK